MDPEGVRKVGEVSANLPLCPNYGQLFHFHGEFLEKLDKFIKSNPPMQF